MNLLSISKISIVSLVLLSFLPCCSAKHRDKGSVYAPPSDNYEVETLSQQLSEELDNYPTRFTVTASDGKQTLERAVFFFETYCSNFRPKDASPTARILNITNENSKDKVLYRVTRIFSGNGFRYSISAAVGTNPQKAATLAANLARFIKEGKLDLELLKVGI